MWNGESSGVSNMESLHIIEGDISYNTMIPTGRGVSGIGNDAPAAHLILERSTLSHNSNTAISTSGNATASPTKIINSTISQNEGYGIFASGPISISNSTIFSHTLSGIGYFPETVSLHSTIISDSLLKDCNNIQGTGSINSLGYNLTSDSSCELIGVGDLANEDPMLGPLQNNGGSTTTHALLVNSPAIDSGDNVNCPDVDQRGVNRPIATHCDIGAFEFNPNLIAIDDETSAKQNTMISIDALANDIPGANGMQILDGVGDPMYGNAVVSGTFVIYTPTNNFVGSDHFTYTTTDESIDVSATITVTVVPKIGPTAVADEININQNSPTLIDVVINDEAGDNGAPVLDGVSAPLKGNGRNQRNRYFLYATLGFHRNGHVYLHN